MFPGAGRGGGNKWVLLRVVFKKKRGGGGGVRRNPLSRFKKVSKTFGEYRDFTEKLVVRSSKGHE